MYMNQLWEPFVPSNQHIQTGILTISDEKKNLGTNLQINLTTNLDNASFHPNNQKNHGQKKTARREKKRGICQNSRRNLKTKPTKV